MTEYTVHFQKGYRVGARSLRMERAEAETPSKAITAAKKLFPTHRQDGYRVTRVDHFDEETGRLVLDY
jgi:hypothetical protein